MPFENRQNWLHFFFSPMIKKEFFKKIKERLWVQSKILGFGNPVPHDGWNTWLCLPFLWARCPEQPYPWRITIWKKEVMSHEVPGCDGWGEMYYNRDLEKKKDMKKANLSALLTISFLFPGSPFLEKSWNWKYVIHGGKRRWREMGLCPPAWKGTCRKEEDLSHRKKLNHHHLCCI